MVGSTVALPCSAGVPAHAQCRVILKAPISTLSADSRDVCNIRFPKAIHAHGRGETRLHEQRGRFDRGVLLHLFDSFRFSH